MKHIEPLEITLESNESIIVYALSDDQKVEFRFTHNPHSSICSVSQEDAFYFKTHDDKVAAFWLTKAVLDFIQACEEIAKPNQTKVHSIKVCRDSQNDSNYMVMFKSAQGDPIEELFAVKAAGNNFSISSKLYHWDVELKSRQWFLIPTGEKLKPILSAILSLHKAISTN